MAFQIREFRSIVAGMINVLRGNQPPINDFNIGSVARSLLEAPAAEIEELYIQYLNGLLESIPVAIYQGFDFDRLPARAASGTVEVTLTSVGDSDLTVLAGTVVYVPGTDKRYQTTEDLTIPVGELVGEVTVTAETAGSSGNTLANTVTAWVSPPLGGLVTVTNPNAISGGADEESDTDRKSRFVAYIASLSRGTRVAVEYAAGLATLEDGNGNVIESVVHVASEEIVPGRANVYIHNGRGDTSAELVAQAQALIDGYWDADSGNWVPGYRAAGIEVTVSAMGELLLDLEIEVGLIYGAVPGDVETALTAAYSAALAANPPGEVLYYSTLAGKLLAAAGVATINIISPASNIDPGSNTLLLPGSISITYV